MDKTPTNGYYTLSNGVTLHFSMNTWYNLKEDTGKDIADYGEALQKGTDVEKAFALAEIVFASAKAHDQEEGNEIDYNIYKIRGWFGSIIDEEAIRGITKALMWNSESGKPATEGKKAGEK